MRFIESPYRAITEFYIRYDDREFLNSADRKELEKLGIPSSSFPVLEKTIFNGLKPDRSINNKEYLEKSVAALNAAVELNNRIGKTRNSFEIPIIGDYEVLREELVRLISDLEVWNEELRSTRHRRPPNRKSREAAYAIADELEALGLPIETRPKGVFYSTVRIVFSAGNRAHSDRPFLNTYRDVVAEVCDGMKARP